MKKFNFSRQEERLKWAILWKTILKNETWDFNFFQVAEIKKWVLETELITDVQVNFHGEFFHNGKYMWPSSLDNARLVVEEALNYTNLYDLFINEPFNSNLNLHKSISSLCEQNEDLIQENIGSDIIFNSNFYYTNQTSEEYFNSLNLSTWPYEVVVISAICYLLENVYVEYHNKVKDFYNPNKISVFHKNPNYLELIKQNISLDVEMLIREIAVYLIHEKYSKKLFSVLNNTNIFRIESFAILNAFTVIFNKLSKKYYTKYLKTNNNIVETLSRFFQVFQLNFIFCNSFIENEIQTTILNGKISRYYSGDLVEILNIYKLFLQNYFCFKNNSEKLLSFNNPKLEIANQKFFVNTFFHDYISNDSCLEINGPVEIFKKMFPSIQFDILQHLEQTKKNQNLKEKLSQIKNTIGFTIGLTGPTLAAHNSFYGNSCNVSSSSVPYATSNSSEAVPTQKNVVRRSPVDIPASLQKRNFRDEAAQFQKYQYEGWKQYEDTLLQSKLSERYTIVPQNLSKLKEKNTKGQKLIFIEENETGVLIPMANVGSYDSLTNALENSKISNGNTLRKAHFFYDQIRQACGVTRGDGLCWLVPSCINTVEEQQDNQKNRDYTYKIGLENSSVSELILQNTVNSWEYIAQTVESSSSVDPDTLDFLTKRFKAHLGHGIAQLDRNRVILEIPENKGLYYLYSGHILQEINDLTEIVKPYGLHTSGQRGTLRRPGGLISDAADKVYQLTQLGKTYIEQLDSLAAKRVFSSLLKTQITNFCNEVNLTALANISDREAGRANIPEFILSFDEIPICDVSNPNVHQLLEIVDRVSDIIQKQPPGDLQKALKNGRELGIGDFSTKGKPHITQTGERNADEIFCHISPTSKAVDYSNYDGWIC